MTADGKYAITGDMVELANNNNLTEQHRRDMRVKAIAAVPESQMLVFGPKDPKYTVTVFTDVDCPYCRKLHSQIAEYNRLGVRVRYLLYPRTGPEHRVLDQGRAGVVLSGPQRCADARQARADAEDQGLRRQSGRARATSSDRSSRYRARRPSCSPTGRCCRATCRRMQLVQHLKESNN